VQSLDNAAPKQQHNQQKQQQQLQLHGVIGAGSFGVVYRATWRGVPAAVKVLQLPAAAAGVG
jgi:predicted Ser/Thr protein kinase